MLSRAYLFVCAHSTPHAHTHAHCTHLHANIYFTHTPRSSFCPSHRDLQQQHSCTNSISTIPTPTPTPTPTPAPTQIHDHSIICNTTIWQRQHLQHHHQYIICNNAIICNNNIICRMIYNDNIIIQWNNTSFLPQTAGCGQQTGTELAITQVNRIEFEICPLHIPWRTFRQVLICL